MNLCNKFQSHQCPSIVIWVNSLVRSSIPLHSANFPGASPKEAVTFPHLVTVSLPSQTQLVTLNGSQTLGPNREFPSHVNAVPESGPVRLNWARLRAVNVKRGERLDDSEQAEPKWQTCEQTTQTQPPTPSKPAWKRLWGDPHAPLPAIYLPSEASCWSAEEPGGVTRGRSKPGEQSLRSRTWFIHVRDRERFSSHHLLSPPRGSPCALLALPTSNPPWFNHAHGLVCAYCGHASWSLLRTRAAKWTFLPGNLYSNSNTELFIPLFLSLSYKHSPVDFVQYLPLLCTVYKLVKYL